MAHEGIADFRSDTVTRPTPAMREAMRTAALGDDVLGDDPTVKELEAFASGLFGKEAALFFPSGTMANQAAVRVHCRPGDEALLEEGCHAFLWEQGGLAQLSGVQARALPGRRGVVPVERLEAALRPDDPHCPISRLVLIENSHGSSAGAVLPPAYLREVAELARRRSLSVHLDGARIANAAAACGAELAELGASATSLTCCLSKGLGAPVGTLLMGSADFILQARRARKVLGGAMRQVGLLAAAGLVALRDQRARLVEDHRRAAALHEGLRRHGELELMPCETNMVFVLLPGRAVELESGLAARGVLANSVDDDTLRLVTHLDVDDGDVDRALEAFSGLLS